jgi:hypothetical protein
MFPIFNRNGKVVAFGGRILHPQGPKDSKYLNSPELHNEKTVQEKIGNIVSAIDYYKYGVKIADYILSDKRLFKNENIINIADEIIYSIGNLYSFENSKYKTVYILSIRIASSGL